MAIIAPSILSADFANLARDIRDMEKNGADWVHVDVMDGNFVPNISIGIPVVKALRPVTGLPLDVHLMIDRPIRYVEEFVKAGADWLTVHLEADLPQNILACLEKIRSLGCKAALSLKPQTPAEAAIPYLTKCDMILVMTVEPGFGGQKFMADMMPKVRALRRNAHRGHEDEVVVSARRCKRIDLVARVHEAAPCARHGERLVRRIVLDSAVHRRRTVLKEGPGLGNWLEVGA